MIQPFCEELKALIEKYQVQGAEPRVLQLCLTAALSANIDMSPQETLLLHKFIAQALTRSGDLTPREEAQMKEISLLAAVKDEGVAMTGPGPKGVN